MRLPRGREAAIAAEIAELRRALQEADDALVWAAERIMDSRAIGTDALRYGFEECERMRAQVERSRASAREADDSFIDTLHQYRTAEARARQAEQECESLRAQLAARDADLEIARGATAHWIARCRRLESKGDPR